MESYVRFVYREDQVFRVFGSAQIRMRSGEAYRLNGSSDRIVHDHGIDRRGRGRVPILVRYDREGRETCRVMLRQPGVYKIGPDRAYLVKNPEEEKNPILRVARQIGIPVSCVVPDVTTMPVHGHRVPREPVERLTFNGARIVGDVAHLGSEGFMVELFSRATTKGEKRFVNRLLVGPNVLSSVLLEALQRLHLDHTPEWDVGTAAPREERDPEEPDGGRQLQMFV